MSQFQYPVAQQGLGSAFASYTSAKTILNAGAVYTIPANYLYVGKGYRINAMLALSNIVTAQPTVTFQVITGPTSNIIAWTSGAITTTQTAHVGYPCKVVVELWCAAIGGGTAAQWTALGWITFLGFVISGAVADQTTGMGTLVMPSAQMADPSSGAAGFDSTVANALDFFVGFSVSQPTNGVQVYSYYVEDLNGP